MKKYVIVILYILFTKILYSQNQYFQTGQEADIILGPYETGANASCMHWPSSVVSDGTRLFVADTRQNRILIWNSIPTENNQPADVVVGQPDFESIYSGTGPDRLNWPVGVFSDGIRLYVADTQNYRVLIWNQIPTQNGQPADLVLGQPDFYTVHESGDDVPLGPNSLWWPWDVFYDGQRLYATSSLACRVLIWNEFPTHNNQPADIVLGRKDFTNADPPGEPTAWKMNSPRSIACDGQRLAIWDYTWKRILIWNTIPTQNTQPADLVLGQKDFITLDGSSYDTDRGLVIYDNKLYNFGSRANVWETFPTENDQYPDKQWYLHCAGWGMGVDSENIYLANTAYSRIAIYHGIPEGVPAWGQPEPDVILGENNFYYSAFMDRKGMGNVSGMFSTGKNLFVTGLAERFLIYEDLPQMDSAPADYLMSLYDWGEIPHYALAEYPLSTFYSIWSDGKRIFAGSDHHGVLIWDQIPSEDGILYNKAITPVSYTQGGLYFYTSGIAVDGERVFLSSFLHDQVLIWDQIPAPDENQEPDFILDIPSPAQISIDKGRMAVASVWGNAIYLYNELPTATDREPDLILTGHPQRFNGLNGVCIHDDRLYVADMGFHRICIYNTFPIRSDQPYEDVIGQNDLLSIMPGLTRSKLHQPQQVQFDGEYLWVREFKFADRVMAFQANTEETVPEKPSNFAGEMITETKIRLHWHDNANNERCFVLMMDSTCNNLFEPLHWLKTNIETIDIGPMTSGKTYAFYMIAKNRLGESFPTDTLRFTISQINNLPPAIPSNPVPEDGSYWRYNQHIALDWTSSDPNEDDHLVYDLYLGLTEQPPLFMAGIKNSSYYDLTHSLAGLRTGGCTYYWKVVAKDSRGLQAESPVWNFETAWPDDKYWKILNIKSTSGGTTNPIAGSYAYDLPLGSIRGLIFLYAYPEPGYEFIGWSGDIPAGIENDNPIEIYMDRNRSITANFSVTGVDNNDALPKRFLLYNNYPNPFNPQTTIRFDVPIHADVSVVIYNLLGNKVKELMSKSIEPGTYHIQWRGMDAQGYSVASGVYFCRITTKEFINTKKLLLLR